MGLTTAIALLASANVFAAGPKLASEASNPLAIMLLIVIVALALVIALLGYVLLGAAEINLQRAKDKLYNASKVAQATLVITFCLFSSAVFAADGADAIATEVVSTTINLLSKFSYYTLLSVVGLEVLLILVMLWQVKALLAKEKLVVAIVAQEAKQPIWQKWWEKMNSFKPAHVVGDTGHNYDGIRELDNKLPPWWLYGFYACIVFAVVYMYRFEVVHSAPSTRQEYVIAMEQAEVEKEEYLKHAANKVDENSVTLLTEASALGEGKKLFGTACAPCHGPDGQGVVGPNLTDDFWLHKGGVKDIFKSIKYGVPEKGMKSWKDDFSPVQIAQIASYIKSISGTKPANAKEPQGDLFKEDASTATVDSTKPDNKLAAN